MSPAAELSIAAGAYITLFFLLRLQNAPYVQGEKNPPGVLICWCASSWSLGGIRPIGSSVRPSRSQSQVPSEGRGRRRRNGKLSDGVTDAAGGVGGGINATEPGSNNASGHDRTDLTYNLVVCPPLIAFCSFCLPTSLTLPAFVSYINRGSLVEGQSFWAAFTPVASSECTQAFQFLLSSSGFFFSCLVLSFVLLLVVVLWCLCAEAVDAASAQMTEGWGQGRGLHKRRAFCLSWTMLCCMWVNATAIWGGGGGRKRPAVSGPATIIFDAITVTSLWPTDWQTHSNIAADFWAIKSLEIF